MSLRQRLFHGRHVGAKWFLNGMLKSDAFNEFPPLGRVLERPAADSELCRKRCGWRRDDGEYGLRRFHEVAGFQSG